MSEFRSTLPKIRWNGNDLNFPFPLDAPNAYAEPIEGSEWVRSPAGELDAWLVGWRYVLDCEVRWVPPANVTSPYTGTGWYGVTGWQAFLQWAAEGNTFIFYPDRSSGTAISSSLLEPEQNITPTLEKYGERKLKLKICNYTTEYTGY